jgi:hypothetical protein
MAASYEDCYEEALADIVNETATNQITITVKTLAGNHYIVPHDYQEDRFYFLNLPHDYKEEEFHFSAAKWALHRIDPESFPLDNLRFIKFYKMIDEELQIADPENLQDGDFLTALVVDTRPFCNRCEQHFEKHECGNWAYLTENSCPNCEVDGHDHFHCPANFDF